MRISQIKKKILDLDKKKKIKFIMLFGSVKDGTSTPLSDIDIAIYYDGNRTERFKFRKLVSGNLSDRVDIQLFQDLPVILQKEVLKGKLIYNTNFDFIINESMKVIKEFNRFEKYYNRYLDALRAEVGI